MMTKIKISAAMCRQVFHGCTEEYINNVCKGACCKSSKHGAIVHILPEERESMTNKGAQIDDNSLLVPKANRCPFQKENGLCGVHKAKPFGCAASPFTVNKNNTLIIRNRYRLLKCYKDGNLPAYKAFYDSLVIIFGNEKAEFINNHLDKGGGDIYIGLSNAVVDNLKEKNIRSKS